MNGSAMYKLGYGLYVLSARDENKDNACIINTAIQVTSSPNRIAVTVNKNNYTHQMIKNTGAFNISVISEKADFSLFKRFGFSSGLNTDKLEGFDGWLRGLNGVIYVTENTNAYLSGKVEREIDLGTHTMFIADVTDGEVLSDVPTATYDYYHKNIKEKPPVNEKKKGYRCKICGYVYEGDELPADFVCPICKHGAEDFEKI
ncbi:MAG: flavin reductase [Clostridiales bacterium]|nr:flavin reductase [Clostridiales bacterium]